MKKLSLLFALLISIAGLAQQGINYKALIKDGNGNVLTNQSLTVQFSILQGAGLTNVYQETHTPTTDANGIIIINIGEGIIVSGVFADINWGSDTHSLKTEIDIGSGIVTMGITQFKTVPYALHAQNVNTEVIKINDLLDGKSDGQSMYLGVNAGLNDNGAYNGNTGTGSQALQFNTIGGNNTAHGKQSLFYNISGSVNAAFGNNALINNTTGHYNTAIGTSALIDNISGGNNTALGYRAGKSSLGNNNVFIGNNAGFNETNSNKLYIENSDADANNALIYGEFDTNILRTNSEFQIGNPAGGGFSFPTTDGTTNQILKTDGSGKLTWTSTSGQSINDLSDGKSDNDGSEDGSSVFLGVDAGLNDDTSDNKNVGIGYQALYSNTTGSKNSAMGAFSLFNNKTGYWNSSFGYESLLNNNEGYENSAYGVRALNKNISGIQNTGIGVLALYNNITGSSNTAIGVDALNYNSDGNNNTAIGKEALYKNKGSHNTSIGFQALYSNSDGIQNTANGNLSLNKNTVGFENTAVGDRSLHNNFDGFRNTAIGQSSLYNNTAGNNNTAIGRNALFENTTGSNNTAIGNNAQVEEGASNQIRIGDTNVTYAGTQVAWTVTSDQNWKEQIRELPYGLDMLMQFKPVDYIRKNNDTKTREIGFIAQDIEALLNKFGYSDQGFLTKDDKGLMSLRYNDFIALLVKAIQDQQEIINQQETNYEILSQRVEKIEELLNPSQL